MHDQAAPASIGEICQSIGRKAKLSWMSIARLSTTQQVSAPAEVHTSRVNEISNILRRPDESDERIDARKHELSDIITETLRRHPMLCYFQGYHDIVQVLLLVLGAETTPAAVARLSLLRIRDFMLPTMTGALSHLQLLPSILKAADADLFEHLSQTAPFYFALPATLTLYAHEIQEYGDIARLFDYLLTNEAAASIYLYATVSRSIQPLPSNRSFSIATLPTQTITNSFVPLKPLPSPLEPKPNRQ
jgi:hypothetical protein